MALTDDDLRDAAAEAGISPHELRHALARREPGSGLGQDVASLVGPPRRGQSVTHVEGPVAAVPAAAVDAVRGSIESQTGMSGHRQAGGEADIVDDRAGVTYRVRAVEDGADQALVRVDVDPGHSQGNRALVVAGVAVVAVVTVALGWIFSAASLVGGGVGAAALGALYVVRSVARQRQAVRRAHAVASRALADVEFPKARHELPAGGGE